MSATYPTVAVIGAGGVMGAPITRNLARAGFPVRAWNRTAAKLDALVDEPGLRAFEEPAAAAAGADVVISLLSDAAVTMETMAFLEGGGGVAPGAIWVQSATIGIEGAERCAALAATVGVEFVDAPLLGTREPAEAGKLVILAAGPESLAARLEPLFEAIGRRTIWVGAEPAAASRLKLAINTWILALAEATAETVALAGGLGVAAELLFDALSGTPLDSPYLRGKGAAMLALDFEPTLSLTLAAKDAGLAADAGRAAGLDLPLLEAVRARLEEAARDRGGADVGATYLLAVGGAAKSIELNEEGS
ncbi:MAG TPA: NAD(P)-dependent oxidoreductase [Solirubrobacterales bacterium]|jgi:3-hydroxyisobutyrate dehydrogenase|nr:NAD(P)-dependent oxidoreductase [Solirubrobacterales bacterium]